MKLHNKAGSITVLSTLHLTNDILVKVKLLKNANIYIFWKG